MARPRSERPSFSLAERAGRFVIEFWWQGRSRRVSTGTADPAAARRALAAFEAGWGKQEAPESPTIGAILAGYEADRCRPGGVASPVPLKAAVAALRAALEHLEPDLLTKEACRAYAAGRGVAPGTVRRELGVLHAALVWAKAERWITEVPSLERPPAPPHRDRWLRREEARRLVEACIEAHVRLFVLLALHTAARSGAILDLEWSRVDLERQIIDFGADVGNKRRPRVPIGAELAAALDEARQRAVSDWVVEFAGAPVGSIKTGFRAACRRAGLAGVTPHVLRHTAATWMAQKRVPMRDISAFLGHKDVSTTERIYAHHHPDYLRHATDAIGSIGAAPATAGGRRAWRANPLRSERKVAAGGGTNTR